MTGASPRTSRKSRVEGKAKRQIIMTTSVPRFCLAREFENSADIGILSAYLQFG